MWEVCVLSVEVLLHLPPCNYKPINVLDNCNHHSITKQSPQPADVNDDNYYAGRKCMSVLFTATYRVEECVLYLPTGLSKYKTTFSMSSCVKPDGAFMGRFYGA